MPRDHLHVCHEGHAVRDHDGFDPPSLGDPLLAGAFLVDEQWGDTPLTLQRRPQATAIIADEAGRILVVLSAR